MAFLTFAEAKVVAPPLLPRKYPAHTVQTIKACNLKNKEKTKVQI